MIRFLERHDIPYHYLCTTNENKREGEMLQLVQNTDFLVLARYMQVKNFTQFMFSLYLLYFYYLIEILMIGLIL